MRKHALFGSIKQGNLSNTILQKTVSKDAQFEDNLMNVRNPRNGMSITKNWEPITQEKEQDGKTNAA